jgi:hypothetical protein
MKNNSCDEVLQKFYIAYYAWATADKLTNEFSARYDLCGNLERFCKRIGVYFKPMRLTLEHRISRDGLHHLHPFNCSDSCYYSELKDKSFHKNKKRIAWVKKQIDEFDNVR